jgi:salicylate hydroxylase
MPLRIAIVGAGIAGLSAGISIRRAGHIVDIYERSGFANEVGAAINFPPNASRTLLRWGLDPVSAKFVFVEGVGLYNPFTMEQVQDVPMGHHIIERYGAPFYFAHRVDLHAELKRLATDPNGPGTPVSIHLRSEVSTYVSFCSVLLSLQVLMQTRIQPYLHLHWPMGK